jgi:hypothetical protein
MHIIKLSMRISPDPTHGTFTHFFNISRKWGFDAAIIKVIMPFTSEFEDLIPVTNSCENIQPGFCRKLWVFPVVGA